MKIPNFVDTQIVDKEGHLTDGWRAIFIELFSVLGDNLSDEGFRISTQNGTDIETIKPKAHHGTVIYNSTTNKLMVNEEGTFKTVTTT